jgi:hypothetical protein
MLNTLKRHQKKHGKTIRTVGIQEPMSVTKTLRRNTLTGYWSRSCPPYWMAAGCSPETGREHTLLGFVNLEFRCSFKLQRSDKQEKWIIEIFCFVELYRCLITLEQLLVTFKLNVWRYPIILISTISILFHYHFVTYHTKIISYFILREKK